MGCKWKTTETNRKLLIEQSQIRLQRIKYLRKIKNLERKEDLSFTLMNHTFWTGGSTKGIKNLYLGSRLVIVHAGGEAGFVPNALPTFKAGSKSGDYYDNMNSENYERWLRTKLMPNLAPDSVVETSAQFKQSHFKPQYRSFCTSAYR